MEEKIYFKNYMDFVDSVTADVSKNDELYQKRFTKLSQQLKGHFSQLDNAVSGLTGEAGEVSDLWKKVKYHSLEFDEDIKDKFIKELGDVCWYLFSVAIALDVPFEEIINQNIDKLKKRHTHGFSNDYIKHNKE